MIVSADGITSTKSRPHTENHLLTNLLKATNASLLDLLALVVEKPFRGKTSYGHLMRGPNTENNKKDDKVVMVATCFCPCSLKNITECNLTPSLHSTAKN
jgi:hypothetical protein